MDNDYELLYLAKEDTENIVDILYEKYKKVLYSKALKYSSSNLNIEDYLNEARLSLNRNRHKILNESISIDNEEVDLKLKINDERYNPERILIEEEEYLEFRDEILNKLTWKEELILTLKEQNYTNKEIAEITGSKLRTVYNITSRIQNKIANLMSN